MSNSLPITVPTTNIANKVRNTDLPYTKYMWPLFETLSNSIHSIEERKITNGEIKISLIRNGSEEILKNLENIEDYPIHSLKIEDNGIGMNEDNFISFMTADSDKKIKIGGKGVGRFICLKAYRSMNVSSIFRGTESQVYNRSFDFKSTPTGLENHSISQNNNSKNIGTKITLNTLRERFLKRFPTSTSEVAREIIEHFLLYFLSSAMPNTTLFNQNGDTLNLNRKFDREIRKSIDDKDFELYDNTYIVYVVRSTLARSHKIHFCAHNRSVKSEPLYTRITDISKYIIQESGEDPYYFQIYVVGELLDESVNTERTGFKFPSGEDENSEIEDFNEVTLKKIRSKVVDTLEFLLKDYLEKVRQEKMERYIPIIDQELPQYRYVLNQYPDRVKKIAPKLSKEKLDLELYKLENEWRTEVKAEGIKIIEESKDITNLEEYRNKYEKFISHLNDVGKSDLARYIVHRKSVIQLLETLIRLNNEDKFSDEDIIHSIFFPIRSTSDTVPHDKQNLWLLDERLTYHSFLSSDKSFKSNKSVDSDSTDRSDLLIYNEAIAFTESPDDPYDSFIIVEFKKPMRDDYKNDDPKGNPIEQAEKYIERLLNGKVKSRTGRNIEVTNNTPFYVYIVCDITASLKRILKSREYDRTADGLGWFKMKSKYYSAYIEVIPFKKVLKDAKERNRILFDKLGI